MWQPRPHLPNWYRLRKKGDGLRRDQEAPVTGEISSLLQDQCTAAILGNSGTCESGIHSKTKTKKKPYFRVPLALIIVLLLLLLLLIIANYYLLIISFLCLAKRSCPHTSSQLPAAFSSTTRFFDVEMLKW